MRTRLNTSGSLAAFAASSSVTWQLVMSVYSIIKPAFWLDWFPAFSFKTIRNGLLWKLADCFGRAGFRSVQTSAEQCSKNIKVRIPKSKFTRATLCRLPARVIAMALCPSASVTMERDRQTDLVESWNFLSNSGLRKFRHGISIVKMCYQLSSKKVDAQSMIYWTIVSQP